MSATHSAAGNQGSPFKGSPYEVPPEPNRWPAIWLAVGVHAALLAFLWMGVNWHTNTPIAVEAEVWDVVTQAAAPKAPPPPPPPPEEQTETAPRPVPKVAPPPPVEEPLPQKTPDIALERDKKRKELQKKREEQERERERELAREREQARDADKKAKLIAEKKERELADRKKEQELAKKEEADKKKLEKEKAEKAEKAAKAEQQAKEKAAQKAEDAKLAKLRDAEMKRLMAGAGNPTSTGSAEKSTAPRMDKGYLAAIAAKVKGASRYAGDSDVPGNPMVSFQVDQLPTGEIIRVKNIKSSGIPAFDEAVERAIHASSPLPKKKDGTVERSLTVDFKLKEMAQ